MTFFTFLYIVLDKYQVWKHNPTSARALMFSAFAVDLSIVAFLFAWGILR